MLRPRTAALAVGALIAHPVILQNTPVRTLSKPEAEYSEPLTQATGVRELSDGRVIVVDMRDKVVQVVDLKTGKAEKIGREGSGPGEYSLPAGVFALPGDSSAVADMLNRRLLVVLPNGKPGGFIDLAPGGGGGGGRGMMFNTAAVGGVDARGRLYSQGGPIAIVNGAATPVDSVAVERLDRSTGKRDTVGYVPQPKNNAQVSGGGGNMQVRIGAANPFAPQDIWAVSDDGRVAVLHAADYSISWTDATGRHNRTPSIAFERLKVTDGHKKEWRESMKSAMGLQIQNVNGKMSAQSVPITNPPEPTDWPEFMPPFLSGRGTPTAMFARDGLLWVRRTGPAGQPPTFDLIDGAGKLVQKVVLPLKSLLVGFGHGTVYTVRVDDDDLQYLQRYRFSAVDRP